MNTTMNAFDYLVDKVRNDFNKNLFYDAPQSSRIARIWSKYLYISKEEMLELWKKSKKTFNNMVCLIKFEDFLQFLEINLDRCWYDQLRIPPEERKYDLKKSNVILPINY